MSNKTLQTLLQEQLGINTTYQVNDLTDTCPTSTAGRIVKGNPNRVGLLVVNLGDNNIVIAPDNDVALDKGILIGANGGKVYFRWDVDFDMCASTFWGIADTTDSKIYVLEVVTN